MVCLLYSRLISLYRIHHGTMDFPNSLWQGSSVYLNFHRCYEYLGELCYKPLCWSHLYYTSSEMFPKNFRTVTILSTFSKHVNSVNCLSLVWIWDLKELFKHTVLDGHICLMLCCLYPWQTSGFRWFELTNPKIAILLKVEVDICALLGTFKFGI